MNENIPSPTDTPQRKRGLIRFWPVILWLVLFTGFIFWNPQPQNGVTELVIAAAIIATGVTILALMAAWTVRSKRNLKRMAFGLACLLTLAALFYAVENFRGKRAWDRCKAELAERGEKLMFEDFVPPTVPDEQNFAMQPIWADHILAMLPGPGKGRVWYPARFAQVGSTNRPGILNLRIELEGNERLSNTNKNKNGNWQTGQRVDLHAWQSYYRWAASVTNDFPVPPSAGEPAADVLLALNRHTDVLEELRTAGRLPHARFPITYDQEDKAAILLPHLSQLKQLAVLLRIRSATELAANQPDSALEDIKLISRLNDSIVIEPILISHLVIAAISHIQLQPVWEGLVDRRWNDAQLAALDAELARRDFLVQYQTAIRGERAFACDIIEHIRRHPEQLHNLGGPDESGGDGFNFGNIPAQLIPRGWFDQNKATIARFHTERALRMIDLKERRYDFTAEKEANKTVDSLTRSISPYDWFSRLLLPAITKASQRFVQSQSSLDLARIGIALERHRLATGEFPESLDALSPRFLATVPRDVVNGQPLKYRRDTKGSFILYSVGWNQADDGGEVVLEKDGERVNWKQGDWVWFGSAQ